MVAVVRVWILFSALLVSAGWILSVFHQLNPAGYAVVFALTGITAAGWWRKMRWPVREKLPRACRKFRARFRRPAPLIFFILAVLILVAGSLYVPANWDSDAYRTPRVLHWLGRGQWHWIHTQDFRMNIAGCGFEWLTAPLLLFTGTDRFLFLINWVSYLMLPGLIFSVFTRWGVSPRVAWWWMWFLSAGWCFVFQAGSVANDSFAVIYALAAVDLAMRARERWRVSDAWLAMLAAALLTGAKQIDIPLALPWLVAGLAGVRLLTARPGPTLAVVALALLVSILPVTGFNLEHYGQWLPLDIPGPNNPINNFKLNSPFWAIVGNLFYLPLQNLVPPIFPWSGEWNELMGRFLHTPFGSHFLSFENFGLLLPGIAETSAGIGLGVCAFTLISICGAFGRRRFEPVAGAGAGVKSNWWLRWLRLSPWIALLVFMAKVGTDQNARQLAPYYVLLFPIWLAGSGQVFLARQRWWRRLGLGIMAVTIFMLVIDHNRPLFPARSVVGWLQTEFPDSRLVARAWRMVSRLSLDQQRNCFDRDLPPGKVVIGYATGINSAAEPGLWLPWGERRVEQLLPGDTAQYLRSLGIRYVVVDSLLLETAHESIDQWLAQYPGILVDQATYYMELGTKPHRLYLVRLLSEPAD